MTNQYPLHPNVSQPVPGTTTWQAVTTGAGWYLAQVLLDGVVIYTTQPMPTPVMVLSALRHAGYLPAEVPSDWQALPRLNLTNREVAAEVKKSPETVKKACQSGALTASKAGNVWLIAEGDVGVWLESAKLRGSKKPLSVDTEPCPDCGGNGVRNGSSRGKQRYICKDCRKTFGVPPRD